MPEEPSFRIAVVCEAAADQRTACVLADRVVNANVEWIDSSLLDSIREWCGAHSAGEFLAWKDVREEASSRGIRVHGHFSGEPGKPDAAATRRALLVLTSLGVVPQAALLIRDSDNDTRRIDGMRQARDLGKWPFPIVLGVAHTKRECWHLAAFEPTDDADRKRLSMIERGLGFDPRLQSHRLAERTPSGKRNAKHVLNQLAADDEAIASRGISATPLETLSERGEKNGLTSFLAELVSVLPPIFDGIQRRISPGSR